MTPKKRRNIINDTEQKQNNATTKLNYRK